MMTPAKSHALIFPVDISQTFLARKGRRLIGGAPQVQGTLLTWLCQAFAVKNSPVLRWNASPASMDP